MSVQVDIVYQTIDVQIIDDEVINLAIWDAFTILKNGQKVGVFRSIDFEEGPNITLDVTDEGAVAKVKITGQAGGGGGGSQNLSQVLSIGNDAGNLTIENLADPVNPQDAATRKWVLDTVTALGEFAGDHDASTGLPTTGSGLAGAIDKGDYWFITTPGTIAGLGDLAVGDVLFAKVSGASVAADFFYLPFASLVGDATETEKGIVQLAGDLNGTAEAPLIYKQKTFNASLTFTENSIMVLDPQAGAINFTLNATGAKVGRSCTVYIKSNGINIPQVDGNSINVGGGNFEPQGFINWLNTINKWNIVHFKYSASGRVNYWHQYEA